MNGKKRIAAILLAAAALTGCNKDADGSEGSSAQTSFSSTTTSSSASSTASSPSTSSSASSTSTSAAYVPEIPAEEEGAVVMSFDPQDGRTFKFSGLTATMSGKSPAGGIKRITDDRNADIVITENGDEFTAVITYDSSVDGFTTVRVYDNKGSRVNYRLKISGGEVCLPDRVGVAEKNAELTEKPIEQPLEQVSEYVVIGSDKEAVKQTLLEVKILSDSICEDISEDYDKLRAIENWVAANIYYDYPAFDRGVPEETLTLAYVLKNKSSVCGGFSNITAALAAAQGIEIYNVHGTGAEGVFCFEENPSEAVHEWNFAVIGGRVIWLDADFDSRNYLRNGGYRESGVPVTKFFDINGEILALTHRGQYAEHRDYFALLAAE